LISESNLNVNNIYKLFKKYHIPFEKVGRDTLLNLLLNEKENKTIDNANQNEKINNYLNSSCYYNCSSSTIQSKESNDHPVDIEQKQFINKYKIFKIFNLNKKNNNKKDQENKWEKLILKALEKEKQECFDNEQTLTESSFLYSEKSNIGLNSHKDLFEIDFLKDNCYDNIDYSNFFVFN
jgi:hypothetical protein